MKSKNIVKLFIILVFIFSSNVVASASDMPYYAYTYDEWGNAVHSPSGYEPIQFYSGNTICESGINNPSDMFILDDKNIYIVDSGNNRIVCTDKEFKNYDIIDEFYYNNQTTKLNNPQGIYVDKKGIIYIADTGNKRIIKTDSSRDIKKIFEKPESEMFDIDTEFEPIKVLTDSAGNLYSICKGIYDGAVIFSQDGEFLGYFGSNKVDVSISLLADRLWKKILPKTAKGGLTNYIPVEYTNFEIDNEDFIYTCTANTDTNTSMIRKLNPMGVNILDSKARKSFQGGFGDIKAFIYDNQKIASKFIDICINEKGFITCLDYTRGRIFQYDQEANLMFAFGGIGSRTGLFLRPVAIAEVDNEIFVLDQGNSSITKFRLTEFGSYVHKANDLFNQGNYFESIEPWNQVLRMNSNFCLAYIGLGKAYQELSNNKEAMSYYKSGNYSIGYNEAYKEYRNDKLREIFPVIFIFIIVFILFLYFKNRIFIRRKRYSE